MESHKNHVPNHQPVYNHHIPIVVGLYPFLPLLTITINRIYGGLGWETSHILRFGPSLNTVQHGAPVRGSLVHHQATKRLRGDET